MLSGEAEDPSSTNGVAVCAVVCPGRLSMARGGSPDSGGSSIFICYGDAPHLDMQYGVFGQVRTQVGVGGRRGRIAPHSKGWWRLDDAIGATHASRR